MAGPATPVVPQIVSASYRTDIPCFHAVWFAARLKAGFCQVQNPYGGGSRRVGRRALVWRYDPIVLGTLTPPAWHVRTFKDLACALEGAVDEVVVSFVQSYRKTVRNMNAAGRAHGFGWREAQPDERASLAATLQGIAATHAIRLSVCGADDALNHHDQARCIDARRLSDIAGRAIPAGARSHRKGCEGAQSVDIGAYDTCTQGCAYCYAVSSRARAKARLARLDPAAPALWPTTPGDAG